MKNVWNKLTTVHRLFGIQQWLVLVILISVLSYILQSMKHRPSNYSVFLFDYEFGFIRRGLLGAIVNLIPFDPEEYFSYFAFYGAVFVALYFAALALFYIGLFTRNSDGVTYKLLFCSVILMSPLFLKNSMHDFGRVDQLGFLCLFLFAVSSTALQRVLIILMPPLLILCHEVQIILTVTPMMAIFLIGALHNKTIFKTRTLVPLIFSGILTLGLTFYILLNLIPAVEHAVLSEYLAAKSPYNTGERSWLLYDDFKANVEYALGRGRRRSGHLAASPLYLLALILHMPFIALLYRIYKRTSASNVQLSCGIIVLSVLAQCVIFFLGIDYSRWIADIFISFIAMLLFLIYRFELADMVVDYVSRYRNIFIALLFIFFPIPDFGVVTP